jgi:hypothetical protein
MGISGTLALTMNDAAARLLGLHDGAAPGLAWAGPTADAEGAPAAFGELTGWECSDSSYHAR